MSEGSDMPPETASSFPPPPKFPRLYTTRSLVCFVRRFVYRVVVLRAQSSSASFVFLQHDVLCIFYVSYGMARCVCFLRFVRIARFFFVCVFRFVMVRPFTQPPRSFTYIVKIKIHSSCEIEDFVETHLCKLCVILRSRVLRVVCPH